MDLPAILQSVAGGLLTGGASAGTTFLTVFKDIKKRLSELEKKVGDPEEDPKTGLYGSLDTLSKSLKALKLEIEGWRDDPPDWLMRLAQKAVRGQGQAEWREFTEQMEQRISALRQSIKRLEDDLDAREERLEEEISKSSPELSAFVLREEYHQDSMRRADEVRKIQKNLASANSFLRGVMAALGYLDPPPPDVPSTPPPPRSQISTRTPIKPFPVPGLPPKKK